MSARVRCAAGGDWADQYVGKTIGELRRALASDLGIGEDYDAMLHSSTGSRMVNDTYTVQDGDDVEFKAPMTDKGLA